MPANIERIIHVLKQNQQKMKEGVEKMDFLYVLNRLQSDSIESVMKETGLSLTQIAKWLAKGFESSADSAEFISCKAGWLRRAANEKFSYGVLESNSECTSMASTINRWNRTEGINKGVRFSASINYETGFILVVRNEVKKLTGK